MSYCSYSVLAFMLDTHGRTEPRKRPRQARSESTVATILEATARILEQQGLGALTTNRVAQCAGVSIGSLYQYFPTKDALLVELIRRERSRLLADLQLAAQPAGTLSSVIDAFLRAGLTHQFARPALSRALEYAEASLPLQAEDDMLRDEIAGLLEKHFERHRVPHPRTAAFDLLALSRGMIDGAGLRGETDGDALLPRIKRAAMGYLAAG